MSLRTYNDPPLKIPSGDYQTDLGDKYEEFAAITLDPTRRIPLYQLAFHDYVAGTWVWRRGSRTTVVLNLSGKPVHIPGLRGRVDIATGRRREAEQLQGELVLDPWEGVVCSSGST